MKIIHNLSLSVSAEEMSAFSSLDIFLNKGFSTFRLAESDPRWPEVAKLIGRFKIVDVCWTEFSKDEIEAAKFVQVLTDSHYGYPEPSDDFGYREVSYDTSNYCAVCGCGLVQSDFLQAKKTSRPGHRHFFQLHWVFDELFVTLEVWESVLRGFGIEQQPLLSARTRNPIAGIVQLVIPQSEIGLNLAGLPHEACGHCGRRKYQPHTRGFFPSLQESIALPLFRPAPYFGSGARAHRAIVMSGDLYAAVKEAGADNGLVPTPLATAEAQNFVAP